MSADPVQRAEDRIAAREEAVGNEYQRASETRKHHERAGEKALAAAYDPQEYHDRQHTHAAKATAHFTAAGYYLERMRMLRGDS